MALEGAERIDEFLNEAKVFFLATVDGDKPKNRPLGFHLLKDGKIYFGVGDFKDVYKQMRKNPYVEIVALVETDFLRYYGKVVGKALLREMNSFRESTTMKPDLNWESSTLKRQQLKSVTSPEKSTNHTNFRFS